MVYFTAIFFMILNQISHEALDLPIKKDEEEREIKLILKALYIGFTLGLVMISMIVCNLRFWYSLFLSLFFGISISVYIGKG